MVWFKVATIGLTEIYQFTYTTTVLPPRLYIPTGIDDVLRRAQNYVTNVREVKLAAFGDVLPLVLKNATILKTQQ